MEAAPPSYEAATVIDAWRIIAPYVYPQDLTAASLVCHHWYRVFTSALWGHPTSIFDASSSEGALSFQGFLRGLPTARLAARSAVHSLEVPQSWSETGTDFSFDSAWLLTALSCLPRLQSLLIGGVSAFDHTALSFLSDAPSFNLRLLDISDCQNATPPGLVELLCRSRELVYLDMSGTSAAASDHVLTTLAYMPRLRVLKLRRTGLRDSNLGSLARCIDRRIRSLDLRGNRIRGAGLELLHELCAPLCQAAAADDCPAIERSKDFESRLRALLVGGYHGQLSVERFSSHGITHLYLSHNPLDLSCLSYVLRRWSALVLEIDVGHRAARQVRLNEHDARTQRDGTEHSDQAAREPLDWSLSSPLLYFRIAYDTLITLHNMQQPNAAAVLALQDHQRSALGHRGGPLLDLGRFPRLRELVVYDVPAFSATDDCVNVLLGHIDLCASLNWAAVAAGRREHEEHQNDYTLPPARSRKDIFALETIVLEMQLPADRPMGDDLDAHLDHNDHENLRSAAAEDFSFFEAGTMDNRVRLEPQESSHSDTAPASTIMSQQRHGRVRDTTSSHAQTDNIARISAYRAERRAMYETCVARGDTDVVVHGYWPGVVRVVRHS